MRVKKYFTDAERKQARVIITARWRAKNADKIRAYRQATKAQRNIWYKKYMSTARGRAVRDANLAKTRDRRLKNMAIYRLANADRIRQKRREYYDKYFRPKPTLPDRGF